MLRYFALAVFASCAMSTASAQAGASFWDGNGLVDPADETLIKDAIALALGRGVSVSVKTASISGKALAKSFQPGVQTADLVLLFPYDLDGETCQVFGGPAITAQTVTFAKSVIANEFSLQINPNRSYSKRVQMAVTSALPGLDVDLDTRAVTLVQEPQREDVPLIDAAVQAVVNRAVDSLAMVREDWQQVRASFLAPTGSRSRSDWDQRSAAESRTIDLFRELRLRPAKLPSSTALKTLSHSGTAWSKTSSAWSLLGDDALEVERKTTPALLGGLRHLRDALRAGRDPDLVHGSVDSGCEPDLRKQAQRYVPTSQVPPRGEGRRHGWRELGVEFPRGRYQLRDIAAQAHLHQLSRTDCQVEYGRELRRGRDREQYGGND